MKNKYLLTLICILSISISSQAQTLEFVGDIPGDLKASTVTIFFEANCDDRARSATFLAFKAAGYRVFVDGERRPRFGGLVTNVTVGDTTFSRKSQNILIRNIHGNQPTDLIATVSGGFTYVNVKRVFIDIIDRKTGEVFQSISCRQRNVALGYDRYSDELLSILDPEAPEALPSVIPPRLKRRL